MVVAAAVAGVMALEAAVMAWVAEAMEVEALKKALSKSHGAGRKAGEDEGKGGVMSEARMSMIVRACKLFHRFDVDGNGALEKEEVVAVHL